VAINVERCREKLRAVVEKHLDFILHNTEHHCVRRQLLVFALGGEMAAAEEEHNRAWMWQELRLNGWQESLSLLLIWLLQQYDSVSWTDVDFDRRIEILVSKIKLSKIKQCSQRQ